MTENIINNRLKQINNTTANQFSRAWGNNFLYYGLLVYTILFYSQPAGRFPVLAPFRIELIFGSVLLVIIIAGAIKGEINLKDNRLTIAVFLFILVMFINIPFAYVKSRALDTFIRVFKFFTIFLMIAAAIDSEKKLKGFTFVYLLMISFIFVQPFLQSLQGKGFIYNNHMMRLAGVTGMFNHPNGLGMITVYNLPFFYYFMRQSHSKIIKIMCLTLIIIAIRVIMLTQSRTAFLGLMTFGFLLWIFSKKKIIGLVIGILVSVVLWQFAPQETKDRFLTLLETTRVIRSDRENYSHEELVRLGSMDSRWELMKRSLIAFKEYPVLGLGLDCFASFSGRRWGSWFPPHNTYLQVLAETGIIGFFSLLLVVIFTFKNILKAKYFISKQKLQTSFLYTIIQALILSYCIFLTVSFFGIELYSNFWWFAGGLSIVILRITKLELETNQKKEFVKLT